MDDFKRPLVRPSATFSPTKSVGEKALDVRAALEVGRGFRLREMRPQNSAAQQR
jgi:hypothetical protein